jgi:hypothetical protein
MRRSGYLGVGPDVFGFLPGYGSEEGYRDGGGFFIVDLLRALGIPSPSGALFIVLAVGVFVVLSIAIAFRPPWAEGAGAPHYAWYYAWVLPFLCRTVYVPLLYLTLACFVLYIPELEALGNEVHRGDGSTWDLRF